MPGLDKDLCRRLTASALLVPALVLVSPRAGWATIVKATRIEIETHGANLSARGFSMRYLARPALVRHSGLAACVIESRRTSVVRGRQQRRTLTGTDVLTSSAGELTLRWVAVQVHSNGRWGEPRGRWRVVAASGAYAGNTGRGELRATTAFKAIDYHGVLVTAQ
jgi:hypothetical protein